MDEELERLAGQYDEKFGSGKADEIIGGLMRSHGTEGTIKVFEKANGREIILEVDEDLIDSIVIKFQ
jgi:hypothetical protein